MRRRWKTDPHCSGAERSATFGAAQRRRSDRWNVLRRAQTPDIRASCDNHNRPASLVKPFARQFLIRFEVTCAGSGDDTLRQARGGRSFFPRLRLQPVADELLIKTFLLVTRRIFVGGPEAAGVGGEDFVDQDQSPFGKFSKLKFRVGDNDAARGGVVGGA